MLCHKWCWFVLYQEHSLKSVEFEWLIDSLSSVDCSHSLHGCVVCEFLFDCVHYLKAADWKWPLAGPRPHFPFPPIETKRSPNNSFWGSSVGSFLCHSQSVNKQNVSESWVMAVWRPLPPPPPLQKNLFPPHPALSFLLWPPLVILHLKSWMYAKHSFWVTMIS